MPGKFEVRSWLRHDGYNLGFPGAHRVRAASQVCGPDAVGRYRERDNPFMKETTEQYVARILGHIEGKDPLKIQRTTAKKMEKAIRRLSKKQLRRRPEPGKGSIAEILAHVADTEAWHTGRV